MFTTSFFWVLLGCAAGSYLFAEVLVRAGRGRSLAIDTPGTSVQSFHLDPAPRLGGIAIFIATVAVLAFTPDPVHRQILGTVVAAGSPVLAIGMAEDFTRRVSVRSRLFVTLAAGCFASVLSGVRVSTLDIPVADALLAAGPIALFFTAFAVAGIANAVNIIDGCHGLASGTVALCLAAMAAVAAQTGDASLALAALTLVAAVVGFGLVNFPSGKLFLGDGGAYFTGFAMAWIAVLLPARNPDVSPWACLTICAYPVVEVLYSVVRRMRKHCAASQPDREHLHSLVASRIVPRLFPRWAPNAQNAATSVIMWCIAAVPAVTAVTAWNHMSYLVIGAFGFILLYHCLYQQAVRHEQ